jgi:ethanolamine kinase
MSDFTELVINNENLKESVIRIAVTLRPKWAPEEAKIEIKPLNGGITNRLVCCFLKSTGMNTPDTVLFRIYGKDTELFISREDEITTMKLMKQIELGPDFYCRFKNGICYEYLPGEIVDQKLIFEENCYTKIAQATASLHLVNFEPTTSGSSEFLSEPKRQPFIFNKIRDLIKLLKPDYTANMPHMTDEYLASTPSFGKINEEFEQLEIHLRAYTARHKSLLVFSHNDLLLGNIVFNETLNSIKFIDYEYGAPNYQAYDIANHFNEFASVDEPDYSFFPNKEYQLKWLRIYLGNLLKAYNYFFPKTCEYIH